MATAYKFSQVVGTASTGTFSTLYTTPASTEAVISTIAVTNQTGSAVTLRIGLMGTAGTPASSEYLVYDAALAGNDTVALTLGVTMDAGKFIRVSSSAATCNFTAFLSEIS